MPIVTVLLPTPAPSRTRNTPRLIFQSLLHFLVDRVVVVLAIIRIAASCGKMFSVTKLSTRDAIVEAVDFRLWWLLKTFVDALIETIHWDASFGVAGGVSRYSCRFEDFC